MAAVSKWSTQKPAASSFIKKALEGGQERSLDELVEGLKALGINQKNARKALHAEVTSGTVAMTGTWLDGKFKARGAG